MTRRSCRRDLSLRDGTAEATRGLFRALLKKAPARPATRAAITVQE